MAPQGSYPVVQAILVLDAEGRRVVVKHYAPPPASAGGEQGLERAAMQHMQPGGARGEPEVLMAHGRTVVYKSAADLHFFVAGSEEENELILVAVLQGLYEAISTLLRGAVEKRSALENLDLIFLAVDETCDNGVVLETDPAEIAKRASMRSDDPESPLGDQSLSQALVQARDQLAKQLLK